MATTIDWATKVISIPKADLTLISGTLYELDTEAWRLELKALEAGEYGMAELDTHEHNTEVTIAGITYARTINIINGYTVTFEDGQYAVSLVGSNNNIFDEGIINRNQVSIIPTNTGGLINAREVTAVHKIMNNKMITDPDTGLMTIYDDDDATTFRSGMMYEGKTTSQQYRGQGAERRERLQ